jgi:hypothetical protein
MNILFSKKNYNASEPIGLFIKILDDQYLDSFVKEGLLYMNPVEYFRGIEGSDLEGIRKDSLECVDCSILAEGATLTWNNISINGLIGRMNFRQCHEPAINLFCMTAIPVKKILQSGANFRLNKKFLKFGNTAVLINQNNFPTFKRMIESAVREQGLLSCPNEPSIARCVEYVSPKYSGPLGSFRKLRNYKWQMEWRIALMRDSIKPEPLQLYIGSLESIVTVIEVEGLVKKGLTLTPQRVVFKQLCHL